MAYFAKFTERGQRALLAAQAEAAKLGRSYVGTEHLLLGVLTEPGAASMVLRGVTLDAVGVLIDDAIACAGEITGANVSEDTVRRIFDRFCVGK